MWLASKFRLLPRITVGLVLLFFAIPCLIVNAVNTVLSVIFTPRNVGYDFSDGDLPYVFRRYERIRPLLLRCCIRYSPLLLALATITVLAFSTESVLLLGLATYLGLSLAADVLQLLRFPEGRELHEVAGRDCKVETRYYESSGFVVCVTAVYLPRSRTVYYLWLDDEVVLTPRFVSTSSGIVTVFEYAERHCLFVRDEGT